LGYLGLEGLTIPRVRTRYREVPGLSQRVRRIAYGLNEEKRLSEASEY